MKPLEEREFPAGEHAKRVLRCKLQQDEEILPKPVVERAFRIIVGKPIDDLTKEECGDYCSDTWLLGKVKQTAVHILEREYSDGPIPAR